MNLIDVWSIVRWWDDWQLRILVLGSLFLQWFLLLAAPMRKYTIPRVFRASIWLAYVSSDALAIYALATLFNRHARASTAATRSCDGGTRSTKPHSSNILEVLWAPVLLIHLGGQEEQTAYEIEDNELWTRHTVTLVFQVAVALYAFYKSWLPSSDWKLLAAAVLLFIIGVASFSEKPLALNRAKIKRLASVSALIQRTKKSSKWRDRLRHFFLFEESNCFTELLPPRLPTGGEVEEEEEKDGGSSSRTQQTMALSDYFAELRRGLSSCWKEGSKNQQDNTVALTEGDKVLMVLSDMSLFAAATDLVARKKATKMEDVLPTLHVAEKALPRWLRTAFAFIYTRATVVVTPLYLVYHLLVVPILHIAALALFAMSEKRPYKVADVKITYIILSLTAALDVLAVFIRQLLYRLMSTTEVPALCETVPGYNLIDAALRESDKGTGWMFTCARRMGLSYYKREHFVCKPELRQLYKKVSGTVLADLVDARGRDLASYRNFTTDSPADSGSSSNNWALSKELQKHCGEQIRDSLEAVSFDRSVLLWHTATDLCVRCTSGENYTGVTRGRSRSDDEDDIADVDDDDYLEEQQQQPRQKRNQDGMASTLQHHIECTCAISNYMAHLLNFNPEMLLTGSREHLISEAVDEVKSFFLSGGNVELMSQKDKLKAFIVDIADDKVKPAAELESPDDTRQVFHIIQACKLAKELLGIDSDVTRWTVMYQVWLGMLCYSASMCRGYLHAKSLGEGGEFLSFVWLVLSLKGAKTLADKLQMPPDKKREISETIPRVGSIR